jgi:hypothetical protein
MALCPFATHKIIPAGSSDPPINARVTILHVAVSLTASLFEFFRDRSGGIESHFYITLTGKLEQYRDTGRQADANYEANDFAVSIETAGMGVLGWNRAQKRTIQRLLLWLHQVEGIPLRKVQNWDGAGVGYHTLFGAPSHWTPVAKSCPGPGNIRLFDEWLVPWMRRNPTSPDPTRAQVRAARRLARVQDALEVARADVAADREELQTSRARLKRLLARREQLSRR